MADDNGVTAIPPDVPSAGNTEREVVYYMAIERIPGVGSTLAKRLIAYCGSAEAVFREKKAVLQKIPGIGMMIARGVADQQVLSRAKEEYAFLEKRGCRVLCYTDDDYPDRLKQCEDGPVVLFVAGTLDLNRSKVLSIVGTRHASPYGTKWCEELLKQMPESGYSPIIVSGLAYGIDICAHRAALQYQLPTIAVMATGLDKVYPTLHLSTAMKILEEGGAWVTDFFSKTIPERINFLRRNRIIAGLSDATLVVESGAKGGALITADLAFSYNRDVLALPGRVTDDHSRGCNQLIRSNKAALVETLSDIECALNWERDKPAKERQLTLFPKLSADEQFIVDNLKNKTAETIDVLCRETRMPMAKLSVVLFSLEMKGLVRTLPGKQYALI
ncbi:MAG: DNA-processing protein DprA [Prevotellaceae bacterium]|jgi:DNA processing protein|nr:DNA-processing protein DprA [Prevotellaceae bacterium]